MPETAAAARIYTAPPIMEAIVQIQFAEPLGEADQRKWAKRLKKHYPNQSELEEINAKIDFIKRDTDFIAHPLNLFSSDDQADSLRVTPSHMTWTRLAPYEGWEALSKRVKEDAEVAYGLKYKAASRLGVRFQNRIDVPMIDSVARYEDYLSINIGLPDDWNVVQQYGWRFERRFGEILGVIQSVTLVPELPGFGSFLLDIDIILDHSVPAKLEEIFAKLEEMRILKNEIFEACITPKARASFNQ